MTTNIASLKLAIDYNLERAAEIEKEIIKLEAKKKSFKDRAQELSKQLAEAQTLDLIP